MASPVYLDNGPHYAGLRNVNRVPGLRHSSTGRAACRLAIRTPGDPRCPPRVRVVHALRLGAADRLLRTRDAAPARSA